MPCFGTHTNSHTNRSALGYSLCTHTYSGFWGPVLTSLGQAHTHKGDLRPNTWPYCPIASMVFFTLLFYGFFLSMIMWILYLWLLYLYLLISITCTHTHTLSVVVVFWRIYLYCICTHTHILCVWLFFLYLFIFMTQIHTLSLCVVSCSLHTHTHSICGWLFFLHTRTHSLCVVSYFFHTHTHTLWMFFALLFLWHTHFCVCVCSWLFFLHTHTHTTLFPKVKNLSLGKKRSLPSCYDNVRNMQQKCVGVATTVGFLQHRTMLQQCNVSPPHTSSLKMWCRSP